MSIVDTTDGDSITSNGVLMVKDKRRKSGFKKASDRKVTPRHLLHSNQYISSINHINISIIIYIIYINIYSSNRELVQEPS